jgi:hypothetical protein
LNGVGRTPPKESRQVMNATTSASAAPSNPDAIVRALGDRAEITDLYRHMSTRADGR